MICFAISLYFVSPDSCICRMNLFCSCKQECSGQCQSLSAETRENMASFGFSRPPLTQRATLVLAGTSREAPTTTLQSIRYSFICVQCSDYAWKGMHSCSPSVPPFHSHTLRPSLTTRIHCCLSFWPPFMTGKRSEMTDSCVTFLAARASQQF